MGRPRVYSGRVIGVKMSAILDLKIRGEAQKEGRSVSEIVRARLEQSYGGEGNEASANKD